MQISWEQRKEVGFVRAFVETNRDILKNPLLFFEALGNSQKRGGEILFVSAAYAMGFLVSFTYMFILKQSPIVSQGKLFFLFPLILLFTLILLHVIAIIMHSFLTIITSDHHSFEKTLKVLLYTFGASQFFQIIPFFGSFIGIFFMVIFAILGLTIVHKVKYYQSITVTVLPFILVSIVFLYLWTLVKDQIQL